MLMIMLITLLLLIYYSENQDTTVYGLAVVSYPSFRHPSLLQQQSSSNDMALQLIEENAMPSIIDNEENDDIHDPLYQYDHDDLAPTELEFMRLISTFISYSERDIQSLTTTSTRYRNYKQSTAISQRDNPKHQRSKRGQRQHNRSKEDGIRYRTLYAGVQEAALEPDVLRAFVILFEDYLPIRLAGRRISKHLSNIMDEVREERKGEITRAFELCPQWDCNINIDDDNIGGEESNVIEYARCIWDTIMDEALLLENSLDSSASDEEQSQEGGVLSLPQLAQVGVEQVLIQEGLEVDDLESIVRQTAMHEENELDKYHNPKMVHTSKNVGDERYLEMTFPIFLKVLYQCRKDANNVRVILQKLEQKALEHRTASGMQAEDISTTLAAKAVMSGSSNSCKKRQRFSKRFDEYVSTFQVWEEKFLTNNNISNRSDLELGEDQQEEVQLSRRIEILKGCFSGARCKRNVAALKIVYMDYAALRVGGDLIFQLMSKIAHRIM